MEFSHFPLDILRLIFDLSGTSYGLLSLWKCGNKQLNQKLSQSVETIELEDPKRKSTSRWPQLLSSLSNLRVLRISRHGILAPPHILSSSVYALSSTLRELSIRCSEPLNAFVDYAPHPELLNASIESCQPPTFKEYPASLALPLKNPKVTWWDVNRKFPEITRFTLAPFVSSNFAYSCVDPWSQLFCFLPIGLVQLELFIRLSSDDSFCTLVSHLPALRSVKGIHAKDLPSKIESFSSPTMLIEGYDLAKFAQEHPNLKELTVCYPPTFTAIDFPPVFTAIESLKLEIGARGISHWRLPPRLTFLEMTSVVGLKIEHLMSLPRTLTQIAGLVIDWKNIYESMESTKSAEGIFDYESVWPPRLEHMKLLSRSIPSRDVFHVLPPSLTHLADLSAMMRSRTKIFRTHTRWDYNLPNLKFLSLATGTIEFTHGIPSTMECLELDLEFPQDFPDLSFLATSSITSLKLALSCKRTLFNIPGNNFLATLPRKLKRLTIIFSKCEFNWDTCVWSDLPDSLEHLSLVSLGHRELNLFGDADGDMKWNWTLAGTSIMPHLSPRLRFLEISLCDLKASDLLALPCYNALELMTIHWANEDDFTSPASIIDAWPDSVDPVDKKRWGTLLRDDNSFYLRMEATNARCRAYPDPRVGNPNYVLEYERPQN